MGNMLTGLSSKILSFPNLMLIPMMKTMTPPLTGVLAIPLHIKLMIKIISHPNFFKYNNVMFNIKNVTKIHFAASLVGYLLTPLNRRYLIPQSMPVCQ